MSTLRSQAQAVLAGLPSRLPFHRHRHQLADTLARRPSDAQTDRALDAYIERQAPERLGLKLYNLRASLLHRGVKGDVLDNALARSKHARAALCAPPPLDKRVLGLSPALVRQLCYDLAPVVRAGTGWPLRVDGLDVQLVDTFGDEAGHKINGAQPVALFIPHPQPRSSADLRRGCIALSTQYMARCSYRQLYGYVLHELVHAAQNQNHPHLLRAHHAWEYTVLKEGHAHWLQQRYLGKDAGHVPTASEKVDAKRLPYWLGMQLCAALEDRPYLMTLLYQQPDLMAVALGRNDLDADAYHIRMRTSAEVRRFTHRLDKVAQDMGFKYQGQ